MLRRICEACAAGDFRLDNLVEMDEARPAVENRTCTRANGCGAVGKVQIMGARERSGRTIAKPVKDTDVRLNGGDVKIDTIDLMDALIRSARGKRIRYRNLMP